MRHDHELTVERRGGAQELATALARLLWGAETGRPRFTRRRWWARLRIVAVPLGVVAVIGLAFSAGIYMEETRHTARAISILVGLGSALPAGLMMRRPLMAWRVAFVMAFVGVIGQQPSESFPWNPVQLLGFIAALAAVAMTQRSAVTAWATVLSFVPVLVFSEGAGGWGTAIFLIIVALLGNMVVARRVIAAQTRALAEQEAQTELERARRAVLQERTRIARELHDVVAHHMSMIAVQAETAPYRVAELPESALEELAAIASSARSALADMRRLLGALRQEEDAVEVSPQPVLADVADLVEGARRAGVPIGLELPAHLEVPEAVGLAGYRIVQEALANAVRHAAGAAVSVVVRTTSDALIISVHNAPGGRGDRAPDGTGHGLVGMRERATLLGGTLSAGPDELGGYTVTARLPLKGASR